jgi:hypothetical protein
MRVAWCLVLVVMAAGRASAQYHPNLEALENRHLNEVEQQRADEASIARAHKPRPPTEADRKAAAWRADHLTCASKKGRSPAQYAAECKPGVNP